MAEVSSQTLHIVARELASELNEARAALEAFGEQQDNLALLRKCKEHLHSVHGALRVSEVYGAALLAEEMGQVAGYLIDNFAEKRHLAEGLDALMRAMVQLPTYLERVLSGGRDMALVLLPLLNDLRAVRGHALLSEGTLLLLNLSSDQQANPSPSAPGEVVITVSQWARRLRTRFQLGLLGWIKGERVDQNLEILSRAAEKLEQVATTQAVFQLWWVAGAILEALREAGLEGTASIKRLLGQADREMKRLYELSEARYAETPPLELLNNLLYYVARATTSGPRVGAVRASFRLTELLPVDDHVEQARESLSAPSVKLMKTVAAAIKEDLGRVKDALDIFVRQGGTQTDELAPQLELLKKIGDTLGVLGLGELRDKVQGETGDLQAIVTQQAAANEGTLLRMAATLIKVEDSLDEQLVGMIVPSPAETGGTPSKPAGPDEIEFRQVTEAVLRECIVNMARIKEAISQSVEKPRETQVIDQIPQLVRGITAGLLMLGKTRAVEIMEGIARSLTQFVGTDGMTLPQEAVDRLADAIVAIEYYMETLQAGRADPWYMLDNAETCLQFLAEAQPVSHAEAFAGQTVDPIRTLVIEPLSQTIVTPTEQERTAVLDRAQPAPASRGQPPVPAPALAKPVDREIDPEFLELFIEEAKDEIVKLKKLFPLWDENPQDQESLVNVRRSFHTLKGSGRMVGAQLIGEFAWSVENVFNRVINKTLERTPDMMSLLRQAVETVPELVEQLETGRAPHTDVAKLIHDAQEISGVRPNVATAAAPTPRAAPPAAAPAVRPAPVVAPAARGPTPAPSPQMAVASAAEKKTAAERMDPALHDIYAKETAGHLATIRDFIAACDQTNPPYAVTEDLHRSCHTLSGTAKTAGARQGIKIAEPLNRYIRKLYDNSVGMPKAGLDSLKDAVAAIQQVVDHIDEDTGFFLNHALITVRLHGLEEGVDHEISRLAETLDIHTPAGADEASATPDVEVADILMSDDSDGATDVLGTDVYPGRMLTTNDSSGDSPQGSQAQLATDEPQVELTQEEELSEIIELEPTDARTLEALDWSFKNFPSEAPVDSASTQIAQTTGETVEVLGLEEPLPADEGGGIVVEEMADDTDDTTRSMKKLPPGFVPKEALADVPESPTEIEPAHVSFDSLVQPDAQIEVEPPAVERAGFEPEEPPVTEVANDLDIFVEPEEPPTHGLASEMDSLGEPEVPQDSDTAIQALATESELPQDTQIAEAGISVEEAISVEESVLAADAIPEFEAAISDEAAIPDEGIEVATTVEGVESELESVLLAEPPAEPPIAEPPPPTEWEAPRQEVAPPAPPMPPSEAPRTPAPATSSADDNVDHDFDPDVAAIFTEEAQELLEVADQSLSSWRQDRSNDALVFELKRVLHTLKGGARMAGIRAMGDLSHELESFMELVEAGQVAAEPAVFDALQASLDELHRMREVVNQGQRCAPASELISRIRRLAGHEPEPEPAPVAAQAPVAAAPPPPAAVVEVAAPPPEPEEPDVEYEAPSVTSTAPTGVVPTLTESLAEESDTALASDESVEIDVEFGADELGAAAPREAVRIGEPPAVATGAHATLDVAALSPELPPDPSEAEADAAAEAAAPALPPGREPQAQERQEFARVDADLLDTLLNNAGEVSIFRSRLEQQVSSIEFNLAELGRTVTRLKEQLRKMELETEAQILHRHEEEHPGRADFDPLELDRYSTIQQLSRAFAESVSDVGSIEGLLENLTREAQNLLLQQSRVVTELQNGLDAHTHGAVPASCSAPEPSRAPGGDGYRQALRARRHGRLRRARSSGARAHAAAVRAHVAQLSRPRNRGSAGTSRERQA